MEAFNFEIDYFLYMKNRQNIYDSLRLKLEKVEFQFETEQKPHLQNRKDSELRFIHPQLVKKTASEKNIFKRPVDAWLTPDPAGQMFNPYAYGGAPVNYASPDGECLGLCVNRIELSASHY